MSCLISTFLVVAVTAGGSPQSDDAPQNSPAAVVRGTGGVPPGTVIDIHANVTGMIERLGLDDRNNDRTIDPGTIVKRGALLAEIDPTAYQAAVADARLDVRRTEASLRLAAAKVTLAEGELRRVRKRVAEKKADVLDVDVAQAQLEVAKATVPLEEAIVAQSKATLQHAEHNLAFCTIRSPTDGVVIDRHCDGGQWVKGNPDGPPLFRIAKNTNPVQVWVSVNEADAAKIGKGQPVRLAVHAYPDATFKGKVARVRPTEAVRRDMAIYIVEIDVEQSNHRLLPQMTADVTINIGVP